MKIGDKFEISITKLEPCFDKVCSEAQKCAFDFFGIDESRNSSKIEKWIPYSCWIEVEFKLYRSVDGNHVYFFESRALSSDFISSGGLKIKD